MKAKVRHYTISGGEFYASACGIPYWKDVDLWTIKRKVTCKQCKKTKIFREGKRK